MMTLKISQYNTNYVMFTCPKCQEEGFLMNNFVCDYCNTILPNVERIPERVDERLDVYKDNTMIGLWE